MSEKLGRYLQGVVPIKNATATDTYWQDKKQALAASGGSNDKYCAYCGERAKVKKHNVVYVAEGIKVHRRCLVKYRKATQQQQQ